MSQTHRRDFLKLALSGSAAFAADAAGKTVEKLIPYVIPPSETEPGVWTFFATTCRECPAGCGMQLWHRDGRVTKAEGIAGHPVNHGGLCARGQSALQGLYDPDRIRGPLFKQDNQFAQADWSVALQDIAARLQNSRGRVAVLSDLQTGAMAELLKQFVGGFGSDRLLFYEAFNYEAMRVAHQKLFGRPIIPCYRLDECEYILSFAADFLETWVSPVEFACQFAVSHSYRDGRRGRMAYVGPRLSMTAANADDFVQVAPGTERWVALAMLGEMIDQGWVRRDGKQVKTLAGKMGSDEALSRCGVSSAQIKAMAERFANAKDSVALVGPTAATGEVAQQTAMAVAMLNYVAGRTETRVDFSRPHALSETATNEQLAQFLRSLTPDDILIVHNTNPAYSFCGAESQLAKAGLLVYLGTMADETAALAHWVLPIDSPLESWGDYEPWAGVYSAQQPTMARVFDTQPAGDIFLELAQLAGKPISLPDSQSPATDFEHWLRQHWRGLHKKVNSQESFDDFWRQSLRNGFVERPIPAVKINLESKIDVSRFTIQGPADAKNTPAGLDLWVWPSIMLFDGRVANRGWLQESPEPVSHLVWDSWVDVHPSTARQLGLSLGDIVAVLPAVESSGATQRIEAPVRITDDIIENAAALVLGQGHTALGRNARGRGANGFKLLSSSEPGAMFLRVTIRKTAGKTELVSPSSGVQSQHHRELLQWVNWSTVREMRPGDGEPLILPLPEGYRADKDIYKPHYYPDHRWAMVIDLDRCNGCGACGVACYAENNLAIVGKEQARRGREMPWLQVAPYRDEHDGRRLGFLPMMCQHCDTGPCEAVCPVFAAVHNDEGLNAQVYNRCIGTRYCSNNCPYKVRRFNWLNVEWAEPLDKQLNPEVTVRTRGVMEKCTFCIQRIRQGEWRAKRENRAVRDGEIQPACAQSCPTRAIIFGDLMNDDSQVSHLTRRDPRRYHVLEELNTKSAVTYLRRVRVDENA